MSDKIPEDYDNLLKTYKNLQKEFDKVNQAFYDSNRQLKLAQVSQAEYEEELRVLQSCQEKIRIEMKAQINFEFEEKIKQLKDLYSDKINTLEEELVEKEREKLDLECKIEKLSNTSCSIKEDSNGNLLELLENERQKNELLLTQFEDKERDNKNLQSRLVNCENKMEDLLSETETLKEEIKFKKEQIEEAHGLIEQLKDEMVIMKMELDSFKNKPGDDEARGNSLFAEVNDRRLQLQRDFNTMKEKYNEMKRDRTNLLNESAKLRVDIAALHSQLKAEIQQKADEDYSINRANRYQINVLTDLIDGYKKQIAERHIKDKPDDFNFCEKLLEEKRKEIKALQDKLFLQTFNYNTIQRELVNAKREIRKWKHEIDLLQNERGAFKVNMEKEKQFNGEDLSMENSVSEDFKSRLSLIKEEKTFRESSNEKTERSRISFASHLKTELN